MLSARGSSVILLVITLLHVCCAITPFSWSDCGVQLNKAIHYKSAAISPNVATQNSPLSINVQASVVDIVYNAETRLMVWKDGDLFLDVYIDQLCDIISNTKGLSCPIHVGQVSFTYDFASVPALPSGEYVIDIRSYALSAGLSELDVIGCVEFVGTVVGVHDDNDCFYESSFIAGFKGDPVYTTDDRALRAANMSEMLQIGPIGSVSKPTQYGEIASYKGTPDVGGEIKSSDLTDYTWALNGTCTYHNVTSQQIINKYYGNVYILYKGAISMRGLFNLTFNYDRSTQIEDISGTMWLDPTYYMLSDQFQWPVLIGNLGPFDIEVQQGVFVVKGGQSFCTCGEDACGVCGGNGKTCDFGHNDHHGDGWGPRKKAAVACGVIGFLLILMVAELSRRVRKERGKIPIDDEDLVDHPEKPDYGTMAIDDAIREGERVV